jgi:flagellar protein FliO/FliZ
MIPAERDFLDMQMLQQFFGEQGARYATFLITLFVLLIVVIFVWWMIRKALGDRLNMSDKPDRRGRPPRLGITESFTVDRQGRRLVMVRRDNVEHLLMIGGPNDFVVETNVVRGERPVVGRQDQRLADADLVPALSAVTVEPLLKAADQPKQADLPKVLEQRTSFAPLPLATPQAQAIPAPIPPAPNSPAPNLLAPNLLAPNLLAPMRMTPAPSVAMPPVVAPPAKTVEIPAPVAPAVKAMPQESTLVPEMPPVIAKPLSLAERIKASLPMGMSSKVEAPKVEIPKVEAVKLPELPKIPEPPKFESPKVEAPKIELPKFDPPKVEVPKLDIAKPEPVAIPKAPAADDIRSKLEDIFKPAPAVVAPVAVVPAPTTLAPATPAAVVPVSVVPAPPVPVPPMAAPVVAAPVVPAAQVAKPVSKNPFDSLEEEMAKLLGRVPDGKS